MGKRIISVIASLILVIAVPFTSFGLENDTLDGVKASVEGVISYKCADLNAENISEMLGKLSENAGDFSADWYYIALSRFGVELESEKSVTALKKAVDTFYSEGPAKVKVTDMQRVALALLSFKKDITDINGHNLLADATYNRPKYRALDAQGVNSLSYALLLLDSKDYSVPKNAEITREKIISEILNKELENGGYALFGNGADIDITSIVMGALAPYKNKAEVKASIDRCINILSKRQDESGAYKSFSNTITAETTAQVIMALTALGINPITDSRFIKNGNNLLDGLYTFKLENGGYCHMLGYGANNIATYQSFCALVSTYRFLKGDKAFFDFTDKLKTSQASVNKAIKAEKRKKSSPKKKSVKGKAKSYSPAETADNNSNIENKETETKIHNSKKEKIKQTAPSESTALPEENTRETVFKKPIKKSGNASESKSYPMYINSILLLSGYAALFALKSGGKK